MDRELDKELPLLLLCNVLAVVTVTVPSDAFVIAIAGVFTEVDVDATTDLEFLFVVLSFDGPAFVVLGNGVHCCPRRS